MPNPIKVLFAGESAMTSSRHVKGFDSFDMSSYHESGTEMIAAMRAGGVDVTYQSSHIDMNDSHLPGRYRSVRCGYPQRYGANTLLLPDRTAIRLEPSR